jgi:hypothetical protein
VVKSVGGTGRDSRKGGASRKTVKVLLSKRKNKEATKKAPPKSKKGKGFG